MFDKIKIRILKNRTDKRKERIEENVIILRVINILLENKLKIQIQKMFNFEIPEYVLDEMINYQNHENFCALVNLAVLNQRLSEKNGNYLIERFLKREKLVCNE